MGGPGVPKNDGVEKNGVLPEINAKYSRTPGTNGLNRGEICRVYTRIVVVGL